MDATTTLPTQARSADPGDGLLGAARRGLHEDRWAVAFAVLLFAMAAVSAVVLLAQLIALDPGTACWAAWNGDQSTLTRSCQSAVTTFYLVLDPARFLTEALGVAAALAAGLLLTVPVTARAARSGMTRRELAGRLLPMLLIGLLGFTVLGFLDGVLRGEMLAWDFVGFAGGRRMTVADFGYEGVSFVARGFLVMGVGALAGAVLRRPGTALVVAGALMAGYTAIGAPLVRFGVGVVVATPVDTMTADLPWTLAYAGQRYRLPDGRLVTLEEARQGYLGRCPTCGLNAADQWVDQTFPIVSLVALPDTYGTFFAVDMAISLGVGGACLLLAFPLAERRWKR